MSSTSTDRDHRPDAAVAEEQRYVTMLYDRLDRQREQASARLRGALLPGVNTPGGRSDRDAETTLYTEQIENLNAVESGLCFGRLDLDGGDRRYIGRIGLFDEDSDYEPLLIDWRAPAARPFYLATAASPEGVRRRRHIRTRLRTVVGLDDEVLDLDQAQPGHESLVGEAALLAALDAGRTGRMRDIVSTIQAEQDRIIRSDLDGVLVVQGGPGTGKTAVALHRAAYLLYTHRRRLSSQGVLIVGPNQTFLRYISQVLPSLAETGVLLCTLGDLYPGITARRWEPPRAAEVKGRAVMVDVLAAAVRHRQEVPDRPVDVVLDDTHPGFGYEHETVRLHPQAIAAAREAARASGRPHNLARAIFVETMIGTLAGQIADKIGEDPWADDPLGGDDAPGGNLFNDADLADTRRELRGDRPLLDALDRLWPELTPQRLLTDLYACDQRLAAAAGDNLTAVEWALLRREPGTGWTPADVPLLDEAAVLLGVDDRAARARAERERHRRLAFAEGVLDIGAGSASTDMEDDPDVMAVTKMVSAERLAERQVTGDGLTTAQRAAADRTWAFGHVIVDEAQELSPMAWRLLMRRCPSRSMTIAGDVAQTGALAGASSWQDVLGPYVADRWRLRELTVSYRTPAEIMDLAVRVLGAAGQPVRPPRSVRAAGAPPWRLGVPAEQLGDRLVGILKRELDTLVADGNIGVIVPSSGDGGVGTAVAAAFPDRVAGGDEPDLERRIAVLSVDQAKGLEFDSVIVVEPERIVADSPRGHGDLYVAMTRATQRLGLVHGGAPLPALEPAVAYQPDLLTVG